MGPIAGRRWRDTSSAISFGFVLSGPPVGKITPTLGCRAKFSNVESNFAQPANGRRNDLHSQNPCRVLDLAQEMLGLWRAVRVENDGDARKLGLDLFKQIDPLAPDRELKRGKPGDIAPRLSQARDEALRHRIRNLHEHDRDCVGGLPEMDEIGRGCA